MFTISGCGQSCIHSSVRIVAVATRQRERLVVSVALVKMLLTQATSFASYLVGRKHPANELREMGKPGSSDSKRETWPFAVPTATESHRNLFFVRCLFIKDDFVVDFSRGELAFN